LEYVVESFVAFNFESVLGSSCACVAAAQLANFSPDYQVTIDVQRFDSIRDQAAVFEAMWAVRSKTRGYTRTGRTVARETVSGDGFDVLAAAHSRALARMSDIAAAIRLGRKLPLNRSQRNPHAYANGLTN
jgi:uncharacterized lipoprotein YmbA